MAWPASDASATVAASFSPSSPMPGMTGTPAPSASISSGEALSVVLTVCDTLSLPILPSAIRSACSVPGRTPWAARARWAR
ncbi:hypothetical protein ACFFX0_04070 [Citricoccus parietis]|uniref:Uncharacterized protein n=1 Tax=Citricoccus parietis TaxID=592307 RepID=A0ABV5FVW2_9MICC